jgi:hypothetical protein
MEELMRLAGRERLGFYPLPLPEAERIRRFLAFPDEQYSALDPCVGDGVAFNEIASCKLVLCYGVELDRGRAEQARMKRIDVNHGNCFEVRCPVESFSLIYLNPPYDFEISEERSQRMEKVSLEHVYRWLQRRVGINARSPYRKRLACISCRPEHCLPEAFPIKASDHSRIVW